MSLSVTICTRHDLYPTVHGGAVKIVRTAEAISRNGCEVTVVTSDRLQYHVYEDGRHAMRDYPPRLVAATRVSPRLKPWLERFGVPDYWKVVEHLLRSLGYPDDEHLLYQPLVDVDFWIRTIYVGRKHKTDWFQAEFPGFGVPAWIAARVLRKKCSVVEHNVEWSRLADTTQLSDLTVKRLREIELQICHLADEVVTCSDDDRTLMLPDDFERHEITVIPHGVDLENYGVKTGMGVREAHGIDRDAALIFFHGTLHYWPNTAACRIFAEEILPRMRDRGRNVKVLVAGLNPPDRFTHPDLIYAGCVDDLVTYIAAADLCAVPLLDGGGTRMKILEYLAARKPVVSTHKGAEGLELVDGREIHLVPDGDWDVFCDKLCDLLDHPVEAIGMGELGHRFVEQYDWLEVGRAFVELYTGREAVRGTDYNAELAARVERTDQPLTEVGAERMAEAQRRLDKTTRKERSGNASKLLQVLNDQDLEPQIVHWADDEVHHELRDEEIVRHIPVEVDWQKPRTMILLLNKRCNLKCDFCDLWHYTDMMPFESAVTIVQRAPAAGVKTLVITGGEPFVHPRIFELIELTKNLGMGVNITTNGTLLVKDLDRIKNCRVDSLSISLDGLNDTHDLLRGVDGTYAEVVRAIDVIKAETDIWINIYFVVTKQNVRELTQIYDMTVEKKIGFDFWPVNGYPHLYVTAPDDKQAYLDAIAYIAQTNPQVAARMDYYKYGIEYMEGRRDHFRCLGLIEQFGVNHEGQLVPCCVWDQKGLQVGSALDEPLDQLFFSERAQKLREQIFEEGCVDQCFNHSLYEFQQATGLDFVVKPASEPMKVEDAVIKESGQAREGEAKARRRAASKARRAKELAKKAEAEAAAEATS
jgi:MoaA/NifB/PqqE/SkfB family radical SAM enzyme/glycosyltransferase involved in cell wall biosynthesis